MAATTKRNDYITPTDFMAKYPNISKVWKIPWIGYLLMMKIVHGKKMKRGCLVSESEVLEVYRRYISHINE